MIGPYWSKTGPDQQQQGGAKRKKSISQWTKKQELTSDPKSQRGREKDRIYEGRPATLRVDVDILNQQETLRGM